MSLHNLARHVQEKGRGDDKMLVHMTPGEVQGLQALAMRHGGSLSINPDTGLPEAGFLSRILPSVVGGAVGIATGMPFLGAAVGGGLGMATSGGNLTRGIMSGLGAYGFSSLGTTLAASGAPAAGAAMSQSALAGAAETAGTLGNQFAYNAAGEMVPASLAPSITGAAEGTQLIGQPSTMSSIQEGFKQAAASPGAFFKQNMYPIGAAAIGTLAAAQPEQKYGTTPVDKGEIQPYTYAQTRNPDFGKVPGAPYFTQTYTAGTPYAAKAGGIVALANGGPVERMSMMNTAMNPQGGLYPQGMIDKTQYATPIQRPVSSEMVSEVPAYDRSNPLLMAEGGSTEGGDSRLSSINTTTTEDMAGRGGGSGRPMAEILQAMNTRFAQQPVITNAPALNPVMAQPMYGQTIPMPSGVDMQTLAPNLGQYGAPRPAMDPSVAAYNQILAERAANEYVKQAPLLTMLPSGGERANLGDTKKLINEYYLSELGRQGEQAGLDFWAKQKADTGMSLADVKKAIAESPEAQARRQATLEASPAYQQYMSAAPSEANFDAAAYLKANPDAANPAIWQGTPYQHYLEAKRLGDERAFTRLPYNPTTGTTKQPAVGGYTYDQATGRFTKTGSAASFEDLTGDGVIAELVRKIDQYRASQAGDGGGVGGKAGGLMPKALKYAAGGISDLGDYSDGGRLLKGPGDGVSDSIPAQIGARQPARLADGEFVVPARIVSELGNGSTDAGARKLYSMMDRIQKKRRKSIGKDKVAVDSKAESVLPA